MLHPSRSKLVRALATAVSFAAILAVTTPASAHCDTTRGPVVTSARAALDAGNVDLVLHWVQPDDEPTVRAAFDRALEIRSLGGEAKAFADQFFYETLVRIHRAGEGAPYTGLRDTPPEPIIAATDAALARGSVDELEQEVVAAVRAGLRARFDAARDASGFRPGDVDAGRAFVAAYVDLTHWVEGIHEATTASNTHDAVSSHTPAHAAGAHDDHEGHVAWIVAGLIAIIAVLQGVFLLRRRPVVP